MELVISPFWHVLARILQHLIVSCPMCWARWVTISHVFLRWIPTLFIAESLFIHVWVVYPQCILNLFWMTKDMCFHISRASETYTPRKLHVDGKKDYPFSTPQGWTFWRIFGWIECDNCQEPPAITASFAMVSYKCSNRKQSFDLKMVEYYK